MSQTLYKYSFLLLTLFFSVQLFAQDTLKIKTYRMASVDTVNTTEMVHHSDTSSYLTILPNYKKRQRFVTAASIGSYGGMLLLLNQAWYANYPRSRFHFFNDNSEWLQVDKVGHGWGGYQLSRLTYGVWKWSGVSEKKAIVLAGLSGPGFMTVIEVLDGFSAEWGFSNGDMAANLFGGGLFVGQQLGWHEQRIDYKFSFHPKRYNENSLSERADNIFGKTLPERMLKDYNHQTYWLSANLKSFFKQSKVPDWLNVAIGYGADGMMGATQNIWVNKAGNTVNRSDIRRYRQWYLAPDIKWSKIKTKSKFLKTVFYTLDGIKFPLPGLELSQGNIKLRGLIF